MLEGVAGIGKTMLWQRGLELAHERGFRVLSCRPSPTEAPLAFSALGDVLGEIADEYLFQLPPPQKNALEISLLLRDAEGLVPDQRAVSLATLTLLRTASDETPLLIAIDDVQWLDASSARVLAFVFRRIEHERCRVLLARRVEDGAAAGFPIDLEYAPRFQETLERLTIGPLSLGAIQSLIRDQLSARLPRQILVSICEASGGNPFYATELARAQLEHGVLEPGKPLEVPESLSSLVRERLAALSRPTQKALLISTTLSNPSVAVLGKNDGASLRQAVDSGIVEIDGGRIRFTHPLPASVVYAEASAEDRRSAHARAAQLTKNPEEHARHLALASKGPNEEVAQELELAAAAAAARAAPDAAAELSELAARLTLRANRDALTRRRLTTAQYLFETGEAERSRTLLEELITDLGPCPERADALILLSEIVADLDEAIRLCRQAVEEATGDDTRMARASIVLGAAYARENKTTEQLAAARVGLEYAERCGDKRLLIEALQGVANAGVLVGDPIDKVAMERALELEREIGGLPGRRSPRIWKAMQLVWLDELDAARPLLQAEIERALAEGQLTEWLHVIPMLINLEISAGNWELAERLVTEALPDARDVGISYLAQNLELIPFAIRSLRGETDARANLIGAAEEARSSVNVHSAITALIYLALFETARGDASEAWRWLSQVAELRGLDAASGTARGEDQPRLYLDRVLAVELLVALGESEQANRVLDQLTRIAERTGQWLLVATTARSRALVEASRGNLEQAIDSFEQALEAHRPDENPFELARTELFYGATLRRTKHRAEAREMIERAARRFETLGAAQWMVKARDEIERIGGSHHASGDELTPTERRVAELVALGQSNKEIAAQLFVSVRTVESNLSKIFRKLEVTSRTELAGRLSSSDSD